MNDKLSKKIELLSSDFVACSKMLTAIGDETRQHLILEMMKMGDCSGVRVGEITEKTNLSRPAVSHHLQIMKDAGIVKMRREGTKNYYYFDPEMEALERLISALQLTMDISKSLPDRSGEDE
jgi:ArsR family transcriptional regulator, arsenate/arsenite/antimonite-responsive transcriptional repressor